MKLQRRRDLLRILHDGHASSQEEIVAALRAAGHDVTQATVSRDLSDVGAAKVRTDAGYVYKLPDEIPRLGSDLTARSLSRTLDEFAIDVTAAGNLVVVTTAPGHASAVARSIDLAGVTEIVGTIAGDDTIFVATPGAEAAERLAATWNAQALEVS